jgi:MFS-type transporter involved in bile tolerance (Atg22 family)
MSAALTSVPQARTGAAAGIFAMSRYVGSISTSLLVGVLVTDDGAGARSMLTISLVCMITAVAMTRWLPTRTTTVR